MWSLSPMLMSLLVFLLISNAVSSSRDKSMLFSSIVMKCLIFTSLIAMNNLYINPLEKGMGIYGGLFNVNMLTQTFGVFIFTVSAVMLMLTAFFPSSVYINEVHLSLYKLLTSKLTYNKELMSNKSGEQFRMVEYALMMVFIMSGATFLMTSGDLVSIFLCMELQSYGLYMLSTLYSDSESATASGLTYFLLGGLSSCFILLGSALLYVNSGTTNLDNMYVMYFMTEQGLTWYSPFSMNIGIAVFLMGFLFKMSAAPFHFWAPDVYDGVPSVVTTYMAMVPKLSIFVLFMDLVSHMESVTYSWKVVFMFSSFLSFVMGSVLGLTQYSMKSLFAYSTMSHVGFMLLGICTDSMESLQACMFYMLQYTMSNLNAFLILLCMGFYLYLFVYEKGSSVESMSEKLVEENNSPMQLMSQVKGYFYSNPFISISLAMTLFSFMGMPPMAGFFAKQMVLSAALDKGFVFLVLVAMITSVMGAVYYLNLMSQMFFYNSNYRSNPSMTGLNLAGYVVNQGNQETDLSMNNKPMMFSAENVIVNSGLSVSISTMTLILLLFMFTPEEWFNTVSVMTLSLYN